MTPPPTPIPQPFLHDLVTSLHVPTVALSGQDGQIRRNSVQGVFRHDCRILSELTVEVDGHAPVPIGHGCPEAGVARFVAVLRHLGDPGADPTVRVERERRVSGDGLDERIVVVNAARHAITATVRAAAAVDFASMDTVKHGRPTAAWPPKSIEADGANWVGEQARTTMRCSGQPDVTVDDDQRLLIAWRVTVPPRGRWSATLAVDTATLSTDPTNTFQPAPTRSGRDRATVSGPADLTHLIGRGLSDLDALTLHDPLDPADAFAAAGSPWYLTLFGRDSLWAARLALPLGTTLAGGTLRALARRQGTRHDRDTAEAPGKIPHEVRCLPTGMHGLPPVYFGTIDATALWVCLLHDAWRWGMPDEEVAGLLDPMEAALRWLVEEADPDQDGFLEYLDETGHGLTNQGWKDSRDSIQFPDGRIAEPPIALSEAQAYAYEAAMSGATLLAAFARPGADPLRTWAARLRDRFREKFWVSDARGAFPAIALDGAKQPVDTATSNLGHLLGTGLLTAAEAATVAARLAEHDLDSGYGLRTMSADAAGFNPLGYHTGSIWPHDIAIAIHGLVREGHAAVAASLATGLLRAAPAFDHQLPEVYAGTDARGGEVRLAYPASCRPQAWSAVSAVALLQAALGLAADIPGGELTISPAREFAAWFPLRATGLRIAGHPLMVSVDADGVASAETTAPVTVHITRS